MSNSEQSTEGASEAAKPAETSGAPARSKKGIVLLVIAIFLGFIVLKLVLDSAPPAASPATGASADTSITSVHNDAVADYDAAMASGKPIYVLFHSLTCEPCVEISKVADEVMPEYADTVVFVNAITDDPSGQELAAQYSFQYIPTSFFITSGGESVADSYTGAMDATAMRTYLDALVGAQ